MLTEFLGRFIGYLFVFLASFAAFYGLISFSLWELNVALWPEITRTILGVASISTTAAFVVYNGKE